MFQTHLDVDYAGTPEQYTCFGNRLLYLPNPEIHPVLEHDHIPKAYSVSFYQPIKQKMFIIYLFRHHITV